MDENKPKKRHPKPCEEGSHNFIELNKTIYWNKKNNVLVFCTFCAMTEFVGATGPEED